MSSSFKWGVYRRRTHRPWPPPVQIKIANLEIVPCKLSLWHANHSTWWCSITHTYISKGNTTQVADLAVLYEFEPPIRIDITGSNHTTNIFRSYQGNKMNCDLWWLIYWLFINFTVFNYQRVTNELRIIRSVFSQSR